MKALIISLSDILDSGHRYDSGDSLICRYGLERGQKLKEGLRECTKNAGQLISP